MSFFHPIRDPVEGTAHVVGASADDPQFMRRPCTMQIVIEARGIEAFSIRQDFEIWTNQWPDSGDRLPVTFDREHHDRIEIHWDRIPTSGDAAAADGQALTDQINAGAGAAARPTSASDVGAVAQPAEDPLDPIAKLAQLHTDGALTDEEFATMKAKILEQPA